MKNRQLKNPERLLRGDRWATARRISRRFCCCCFRVKAIARAPSLHGSPSPTWFTFSYSAESAGRRCTSRLSAPLGRRAAFSHRLVVARFTAFLDFDPTHTLDYGAIEETIRSRFILSYFSDNQWLRRAFIIRSRWYLREFVLESRRYFSIDRLRKKKISCPKKCQRGAFHWWWSDVRMAWSVLFDINLVLICTRYTWTEVNIQSMQL